MQITCHAFKGGASLLNKTELYAHGTLKVNAEDICMKVVVVTQGDLINTLPIKIKVSEPQS